MLSKERPKVANLPLHASLDFHHGRWRVYFAYTFSVRGKRGQERDYIGHVETPNNIFVPNEFYATKHPPYQPRDPSRWKNPEMRKRAALAAKERELVEQPPVNVADLEIQGDYSRIVGASALAVKLLELSGMSADVGRYVFHGNVKETMDLINLALHTALTAKPNYLAFTDSGVWKYIGHGCIDAPESTLFLHSIGQDLDLSIDIGKARAARLKKDELLALDGTKITSHSKQISIAVLGKDKKGGYDTQISFSVIVNNHRGAAVCYHYFAGNTPDISTLEDFLHLWDSIGVKSKNPIIELDRGYGSSGTLVTLDVEGYRFIIGLRSDLKQVEGIVEKRYSDFYEIKNVLPRDPYYGVHSPKTFEYDGVKRDFEVYVYRNPKVETKEAQHIVNELDKFERKWNAGDYDWESNLLKYYESPRAHQPLKRDDTKVELENYTKGFFAIATNLPGLSCEEVLHKYALRNEVEVVFGNMFDHLVDTTRVHSLSSLEGLMLVIFVALDILTSLRRRMNNPMLPLSKYKGRLVRQEYTISKILRQLNTIMI
ncbi:MAG: transposase, partial [Burkholderiales bacterium]|nr:transposase [Burkholderiales bacterium]